MQCLCGVAYGSAPCLCGVTYGSAPCLCGVTYGSAPRRVRAALDLGQGACKSGCMVLFPVIMQMPSSHHCLVTSGPRALTNPRKLRSPSSGM